MTADEKRMHRAQLIVDIEDAESNLSSSREKALKMVCSLQTVIRTLQRNIELEPSTADFTADGDIASRLTPDQHANFVTALAVATEIGAMKRCRQDLFNFRERKRKIVLT
jgi:hypothetical protein